MLDRVVVSRTCLGSLAVCVGVGLSADPEIVPAGVAVVGLITSDCSPWCCRGRSDRFVSHLDLRSTSNWELLDFQRIFVAARVLVCFCGLLVMWLEVMPVCQRCDGDCPCILFFGVTTSPGVQLRRLFQDQWS